MKKIIVIFLLVIIYSFTANAQSFNIIDSKTFSDSLQTQQNPSILDVRTPREFKEGHIRNSINIDVKNTEFKNNISALDKTKTYYVYCRSGTRSAAAVALMKSEGFKNIYELGGGMLKWVADGMQTVKEVGE